MSTSGLSVSSLQPNGMSSLRLLLFSDVHRDADACRALVERSAEVDIVVGAGDFCTGRRGLEAVIDQLSEIAAPAIFVPGNAESADELAAACRDWSEAHVLHGSVTEIGGIPFFGIGGGIPITPFGDWSWDLTEEEADALLADCPDGAVLVSHSPPRGAVDLDSSGRHLGSRAVRRAVDRAQPRLVVCGHIHASWGGREELGETTVVNAGPEGVVWEMTG